MPDYPSGWWTWPAGSTLGGASTRWRGPQDTILTATTAATTMAVPITPTNNTATNDTWWWARYDWYRPSAYSWLSSGLTPTPEQVAQREAERQQHESRQRERATRQTMAVERATATLLGILDDTQRAAYGEDRTFEVIGSLGGRYRIRPGSAGNVDWIDPVTNDIGGVLCAHPILWDGHGHLPGPDVALAQMLALATDEAHFVATANVHRGRRPTLLGT